MALENSVVDGPSCSVLLYEGREPLRAREAYRLKLGEHVRIDAEHIQHYCFNDGSALQEDIAAVLSAIRTADRACTRSHSKGWARSLALEVPVYDLALWKSESVSDALVDALQYLTGDRWTVTFKSRKGQPSQPRQPHLVQAPEQHRFFIPYSSGLDSYALAYKTHRADPTAELILVNVQAAQNLTQWENLAKQRERDFHAVQVGYYFIEPHRAEQSFRSRPLIYDLLACLGAALAQPARVLIPENGQGSLGGSLVPLGDEAPHRSCHPGFTKRLSRLVQGLTNVSIQIEHPALFQTKGVVLAELAEANPAVRDWLAKHRSCSYDSRHSSRGRRTLHCGVCGNCLLRRVATQWARLDDSTEYEAEDMTAATFEASYVGNIPRTVSAKRDVALNSVRAMQRLADLADNTQNSRVVREVANLTQALDKPIEEVRVNMNQFLQQHKTEWTQFLASCGQNSWVTKLARS